MNKIFLLFVAGSVLFACGDKADAPADKACETSLISVEAIEQIAKRVYRPSIIWRTETENYINDVKVDVAKANAKAIISEEVGHFEGMLSGLGENCIAAAADVLVKTLEDENFRRQNGVYYCAEICYIDCRDLEDQHLRYLRKNNDGTYSLLVKYFGVKNATEEVYFESGRVGNIYETRPERDDVDSSELIISGDTASYTTADFTIKCILKR